MSALTIVIALGCLALLVAAAVTWGPSLPLAVGAIGLVVFAVGEWLERGR